VAKATRQAGGSQPPAKASAAPTWSAELEAKVLELHQENPRSGKGTLPPILRREGIAVSVSMTGRILSRLK
jgi:hypothetical protein